ncbi:hypothetical protein MSAN_02111600 [Mycena sanguinolenta]|uniref:Uncharacterized protein n=1 Tax=Mycena sanguinolenta TaxID=230812 RepID=A0A8H6XGP3_9AGAR|nr:hypothetical protein MSAN_02111600 [Mycena sanguinolenta]
MDLPALVSPTDGTIQEQVPLMAAVSSNRKLTKVHNPERYGLTVSVKSVAYLTSQDRPGILYCAVLLDMTLNNFGEEFYKSNTPFDARLSQDSQVVAPPPKEEEENCLCGPKNLFKKLRGYIKPRGDPPPPQSPELDLPFIYPHREEYVRIGTQKVAIKEDREPKLAISAGLGSLSAEGVGNHREKNSVKVESVRRVGSTPTPRRDDPAPLFTWEFFNNSMGPYPSMHTTIVLVSSEEAAGHGAAKQFSFTLTLLHSFNIETHRGLAIPKMGKPHGWSFFIKGHYHPEVVNRMLEAYRAKGEEFKKITLEGLAEEYKHE